MKKALVALLVLAMTTSLAACAQVPAAAPAAEAPAAEQPAESEGPAEETADLGDYPSKTITVIVPYAAGGGCDATARNMINAMDVPVDMVAVNVEGASGFIGTMQCYEAEPDGYTILSQSAHDVMGYSLSGTTEISLMDELIPICNLVAGYNSVATNPKNNWSKLEDVVEYAQAHPGEIKWACIGSAGLDYATTKIIVDGLGIGDLVTIVPYNSGADVVTALLGEHVQMATSTLSDFAGSYASGDALPLCFVAQNRLEAFPDVPTTGDYGINYTLNAPRGFYLPPNTPEPIVKYLQEKMLEVSKNPEFIEAMAKYGLAPEFRPTEEAYAMMQSEIPILEPVFSQNVKQ
jgi:tripartite-type tricarboxylate transporter receptor subunit TctC